MSTSTEVAGMAEAAEIVGVTKSNFSAHRTKYQGENECPEPTAVLTCGPVWVGADVKALRKWGERFSKIRVTRAPAGSPKKVTKPATKASPSAKAEKPVNGTPSKAVAKAAASSKKAAAAPAPAEAPVSKKGLFKK